MIAAPGSSILPSPVAVQPACAACRPGLRAASSICCVARVRRGRPVPSTAVERRPTIRTPRRSCGRRLVHRGDHRRGRVLLLRRERRAASSCTALHRAVRPVVVRGRQAAPRACCSSSTMTPPGGSIACGCAFERRRSRATRSRRCPFVGRPRSTPAGADRQPAAEKYRDVAVVGVDPVEGELDLAHRDVMKLFAAVGPVPCRGRRTASCAQDLAPARGALRARSRPSRPCTVA